jgi:Trk K+ transport system NAD-binding subunit/nucleotide-binding universal stress UspA family protein
MTVNILVCGAGNIARELLKQLGEEWEVTLVEKSEQVLNQGASLCANLRARHADDASSPVVLKKAGIAEKQYVLAMTGSDEVNLAVCRFAGECGVPYVSALVHEPEIAPEFQRIGVHVVMTGMLTARNLYHYLQDPRVGLLPLTGGMANVYEINVSDHFRVIGKRASYFQRSNLRLSGIFRRGKLMFPKPGTVIQADDRLILLGEANMFTSVCSLLECSSPHFPLAYGPNMLVVLPRPGDAAVAILREGQYLGQKTKVRKVTIVCGEGESPPAKESERWPQEVSVEIRPLSKGIVERVRSFAEEGTSGLLLIPPVERSLFSTLGGLVYTSLTHDLNCPVLIARQTFPYKRILVPFHGTTNAELALEVGMDLGRQLGAMITVMIVEEPGFLSGDEDDGFVRRNQARIRELAHIHKTPVEQISVRGNPVRQIVDTALSHDLLVIGSTNRDRGFITPNIGEHLAEKAPCSVLIVTA